MSNVQRPGPPRPIPEDVFASEELSHKEDRDLTDKVDEILLGGSHQSPLGRVKCLECGFINVVYFLDKKNLPVCQNPGEPLHKLVLP